MKLRGPGVLSISQCCVAFLAAVAIWAVLALGLASTLSNTRPYAARAIYAGDAGARLRISRTLEAPAEAGRFPGLGEHETAREKREVAVAALRRAPLSAEAFRQLAIVAQNAGDVANVRRLLAESLRRDLRDADVSGRILQQNLGQNRLVDAVRDVDAVLRARDDLLPVVMPLLMTFGGMRETQTAVIDAIRRQPPWRKPFLEELAKTPAGEPLYLAIQSALRDTPGALTPYETKNLLFALTSRGHSDQALSIWLQLQPGVTIDKLPLLYNGRFDLPVNDSPFNWLVTRSKAGAIRIASLPDDPERRGLNVEFAGQREPFAAVEQTLTLLPGRYRLTGRFRPDDFQNARGLVWRVYCGAPATSRLAETERLLPGPPAWRPFALDFEVPTDNCRSQYLRLELPARIPAEMAAFGGVWFTDFGVVVGD